ncbi:hypothetical protein [Candidatus Nitrotoga arctica]|uniref:Uncharacterized protein n=1 Tax=Candidatus Nitrotoga arctica TaxID=453162 RepID=A0ABN8AKV4_9PROT|nr:hypothetical protein [Candidatus Nitrotoga arctica]CAG9933390.1 conserved exported protein of unknown function [Candidatus Nitrotoga arctica]
MKRLMVTSIVLFAGISGKAMALDCQGNSQLKDPALIADAISNKTVCAMLGSQKWQEFHGAGGSLIDYKKGPTDPMEKTKQVGTWSTSGNGGNSKVTYNYGTGGSPSYKVHLKGGTYTFCGIGGAPTVDVTLLSGQVSCGFK